MYVVEIHAVSFWPPGLEPHRVIATRRFRRLWRARLYALPYRMPIRLPLGVILWPEIHQCH